MNWACSKIDLDFYAGIALEGLNFSSGSYLKNYMLHFMYNDEERAKRFVELINSEEFDSKHRESNSYLWTVGKYLNDFYYISTNGETSSLSDYYEPKILEQLQFITDFLFEVKRKVDSEFRSQTSLKLTQELVASWVNLNLSTTWSKVALHDNPKSLIEWEVSFLSQDFPSCDSSNIELSFIFASDNFFNILKSDKICDKIHRFTWVPYDSIVQLYPDLASVIEQFCESESFFSEYLKAFFGDDLPFNYDYLNLAYSFYLLSDSTRFESIEFPVINQINSILKKQNLTLKNLRFILSDSKDLYFNKIDYTKL